MKCQDVVLPGSFGRVQELKDAIFGYVGRTQLVTQALRMETSFYWSGFLLLRIFDFCPVCSSGG
jgi:hypothetical protein